MDLINLLLEWNQWEADLINDNAMWWPHVEKDRISGKTYDKMIELQVKRKKALEYLLDVSEDPNHNLSFNKQLTFDEFIKHGLENGANIVNGRPWSWKINGKSITHENDDCYIVETIDGNKKFERGQYLFAFESGLKILVNYDTHSPGGCPM